jgi:hypothetical protein
VRCTDWRINIFATLTPCGGSYSNAKPFGWVSVVRIDPQTGSVILLWDGEQKRTVSHGKPVVCSPIGHTGHLKSSEWLSGGKGFFLFPPDGSVKFISGSPDGVLWPDDGHSATRLDPHTGVTEVLWN